MRISTAPLPPSVRRGVYGMLFRLQRTMDMIVEWERLIQENPVRHQRRLQGLPVNETAALNEVPLMKLIMKNKEIEEGKRIASMRFVGKMRKYSEEELQTMEDNRRRMMEQVLASYRPTPLGEDELDRVRRYCDEIIAKHEKESGMNDRDDRHSSTIVYAARNVTQEANIAINNLEQLKRHEIGDKSETKESIQIVVRNMHNAIRQLENQGHGHPRMAQSNANETD